METVWFIGAIWTIYGVAGLLGHQYIKPEYKNREWTLEYKKECGRCWTAVGVPWLAAGIFFKIIGLSGWRICLIIFLISIPGVVYSVTVEKKYKHLLNTREQN